MKIHTQALTALVKKAVDDDQTALKLLYTHYVDAMFNISIRMTGNREDAEDIVQESFIKAFKNLKQLREGKMFGGWLRQIVINNCLQLSKKKIAFSDLPLVYEMADEEDEDWFEFLSFEKIHQSIKGLPEGCRQIFLLHAGEDYSHREIARLLNISESTSKSQYLRAKKILRQQLIITNG